MNKEEKENIKSDIEDLESDIDDLKGELEDIETEMSDYENHSEEKLTEYKDSLDENYDLIYIGNCVFNPSEILEKCDPIAFNCGMNDWADGYISELGDDKTNKEDEIKDLEEQKTELETQLK